MDKDEALVKLESELCPLYPEGVWLERIQRGKDKSSVAVFRLKGGQSLRFRWNGSEWVGGWDLVKFSA